MLPQSNRADSHWTTFLMSATTDLKKPVTAVTASSRLVMTSWYSLSTVWMTVCTAFSVNCQAILPTFSAPLTTLLAKSSISWKMLPRDASGLDVEIGGAAGGGRGALAPAVKAGSPLDRSMVKVESAPGTSGRSGESPTDRCTTFGTTPAMTYRCGW